MTYSTSTALRSSSSPSDSSRTMTVTIDPTKEESSDGTQGQDSSAGTARILRLRGARSTEPRVAWDNDVVDNEHMGKKKSKSVSTSPSGSPGIENDQFTVCCIYHKPRRFDESSSEESSSDESDTSSSSSCGGKGHNHDHGRHRHRHNHRHKPRDRDVDSDSGPETNAYERQPQKKEKGKAKP